MRTSRAEAVLAVEAHLYDRLDIASAELLGDRDLLLTSSVAALLRRPLVRPVARLAIVATTPDEECLTMASVGTSRCFNDLSVRVASRAGTVSTVDLLLLANVREERIRRLVQKLENPAWIYAGPETGGAAELRVLDHSEVLGPIRPDVIVLGIRAMLSPRQVSETYYKPEGQWGRLAHDLERQRAAENPSFAYSRRLTRLLRSHLDEKGRRESQPPTRSHE